MAGTKKRSAPTAASQRPAKKRKSAEASMAKMKQIAEAEDAFSEDERAEVKPLVLKAKATADPDAESEGEGEEGFEGHDMVTEAAAPVVAPGFRLWKTNSKLASKGELSQVSKYDKAKDEFSHFLKVKDKEEFTLMPLIITQGPYKGRKVFMLEPTQGFRFMDFPAEIRNQIYSYMVEADDSTVRIRTAKKVHEPRRPVMGGDKYDAASKKMTRPRALFSTLLRTNKQVLSETGPILYGTNHFQVKGLGDLRIFVDRIGSMRKYLCHIHIDNGGFQRSKAAPTFSALKDATDLRTLAFAHENVCQDKSPYYYHRVSIMSFFHFLRPLMKALHRAQIGPHAENNVLDIVKLEWERCTKCHETEPEFPKTDDGCTRGIKTGHWSSNECKVLCKDLAAHCEEVQKKIRVHFAKELGIKEEEEETVSAREPSVEL